MTKRILTIGKVKHCGHCHADRSFHKQPNGLYRCEVCNLILIESSQVKEVSDIGWSAYCVGLSPMETGSDENVRAYWNAVESELLRDAADFDELEQELFLQGTL